MGDHQGLGDAMRNVGKASQCAPLVACHAIARACISARAGDPRRHPGTPSCCLELSVFERQTYWSSTELDKIAARFDPSDPGSVELIGVLALVMQGKKQR